MAGEGGGRGGNEGQPEIRTMACIAARRSGHLGKST